MNCKELRKLLNNIRPISGFSVFIKNAGISSRLYTSTSPAWSETSRREDKRIRRDAKATPRRHTRPPLMWSETLPYGEETGDGSRQAEACACCRLHLSHTSVKENLRRHVFATTHGVWFHLRRDSFQLLLHVGKCLQRHQGSFIYQVGV